MAKIAAGLRGSTRDEVERLGSAIDFFTPKDRFDLDDPHLATLHLAIREHRVVRLRYHSYAHDETTERDVEPHRLTYSDAAWYLSGYCRARRGTRTFRLNRIESLTPLPETFEPPRDVADETSGACVEVRVWVDERMARWVRERQHYAFVHEEPTSRRASSGVVMTYRVDALNEIVHWLRAWGAAVETLDPPELREILRQEARKVVDMLT